jgi:hypothetical protein
VVHQAEIFFEGTTFRNNQERYVVRLPFKENPSRLGQSKDIATKRFYAMEKKLTADRS